MNYHGFGAEALANIALHVRTDRHDGPGARHNVGGLRVRVPTGRAEGKKLRSVRQVNEAVRGGIKGFAQQHVADVFGRYQYKIGLTVLYLLAQNRPAADEIFDGENRDPIAKRA